MFAAAAVTMTTRMSVADTSQTPSAIQKRTPSYPAYLSLTLLTAIVVIASLLRFHAIGQKNIWVDEGVSIALARLDWYNFVRILWRHEANMTLYYLFLRAWLPFGSSEPYIRTLSALFGIATIPAVFVLARRMFDARVGLIASLLLAVNAYAIRYSQEARSYSLYPFLCVLSTIYFLKYLQQSTRTNRIAYVVLSVLTVYAHFFAGLLIIAQYISVRLLDPKTIPSDIKKTWKHIAFSVAPLLIFVATTGVGVLRWVPRPRLSDLRTCFLFLTGNGGTVLMLLYAAAVAGAMANSLRRGLRRPFYFETWRYAFLFVWLAFPILFVFLISQLKPLFVTRYFVFTIPALVILAAAGLARIRPRSVVGALLLVFAFLSFRGDGAFYQKDFDISRDDWRAASRYVLARSEPGDVILFHQPITRMPYEYYKSVTPAENPPAVIYPQHGARLMFRDFYAGRAPDAFLASIPARYQRIWVALSYNQLPTGPDPTTRFLTDLFKKDYHAVTVREFPGIEVRLYSNATETR
jgi:mannosyltransferase